MGERQLHKQLFFVMIMVHDYRLLFGNCNAKGCAGCARPLKLGARIAIWHDAAKICRPPQGGYQTEVRT
jgi:hypothetical protein